jgi:hypothetical protein
MQISTVYLAARYSRRLELCRYREDLDRIGVSVTSRWLNGDHQIGDHGTPIGETGTSLIEGYAGGNSPEAAALRLSFAQEDVSDVMAADIVISFTEPPRSTASRGGRHVEFGLALGLWLSQPGGPAGRLWVVGYRENVFHWLPWIQFFPTWEHALGALNNVVAGRFDLDEAAASVAASVS